MASFTWKLDLNFNCAFALKSLLPCKYEQINWPHVSFSHFIFSLWQQNKYEKINHLKYIKSRGYDYVKLMPIRHIYASSIFVLMKFPAYFDFYLERKTYWSHGCRNFREPLTLFTRLVRACFQLKNCLGRQRLSQRKSLSLPNRENLDLLNMITWL